MKLNGPKIEKIIKDNSLYMCLECGKCSASCPRMQAGKEYSPRLLAEKLISEPEDESYIETAVWECLTCGQCEERCPSGVSINNMVLELRGVLAGDAGPSKGCHAHDGAIHSWMRMMTAPHLKQDRLGWVEPSLKVTEKGPVAFFAGCAPYFDVFFENLEVDTLSVARDSIKLLNFMNIEPVLLENERCCGHDLLWTGDEENFIKLCELNYEQFKKAGVEEIVVSCPECYHVLGGRMPEVIKGFDIKVTLLMELLTDEINKGGVSFSPLKKKISFQDPCRLGRMAGKYDPPRDLLNKIPGLKLIEMENHGKGAVCCGNNAFVNCDAYSKKIQVGRLKEMRETGADFLVTSCPKCMIHLTCAMADPVKRGSLKKEIRDLTSVMIEQIERSDD